MRKELKTIKWSIQSFCCWWKILPSPHPTHLTPLLLARSFSWCAHPYSLLSANKRESNANFASLCCKTVDLLIVKRNRSESSDSSGYTGVNSSASGSKKAHPIGFKARKSRCVPGSVASNKELRLTKSQQWPQWKREEHSQLYVSCAEPQRRRRWRREEETHYRIRFPFFLCGVSARGILAVWQTKSRRLK